MKRLVPWLLFVMLFGLFGCSTRTCTCVDIFGGIQTGIEITAFEDCSDLEPMMGTCTEE